MISWWWVKVVLSLFITFRTNVRMSVIPSACSFFFALHLEMSLKRSIHRDFANDTKHISMNNVFCSLLLIFSDSTKLEIVCNASFEKCCNFYSNNSKFCAVMKNFKYLQRYCTEIWECCSYKFSKIWRTRVQKE